MSAERLIHDFELFKTGLGIAILIIKENRPQ